MRHRRMLAPLNTIKHYVHLGNSFVSANAILVTDVANAKVAPATGASSEVKEGSLVKAIYVELWIFNAGATTTTTQFVITLEKIPSGATAMTFAQSGNLGAYPNKKNILYSTEGVLPANIDGSGAVPVIRQYFLIPKGKQRMGLADRIVLNIATTGQNLRRCGIFTFKEWI